MCTARGCPFSIVMFEYQRVAMFSYRYGSTITVPFFPLTIARVVAFGSACVGVGLRIPWRHACKLRIITKKCTTAGFEKGRR